ncbi:hypothetical protein CEP54_011977 [Fusarium duplospermum]|uniref:Fucose-specific lectin n=1 Tax=Fusarium duplospermum TaxID=1325734 RepID=A0A428PBK5_9HYPO|nr:hypothetical protein CEP54_011977 [Fusarium duplospermum]
MTTRQYSDLPEAVSNPDNDLPEPTSTLPVQHSSLPEAVGETQKDNKEFVTDTRDYAPVQPGTPATKLRRICGLKRKTFFIVAAVLIIIVGAAVGGGVGATVGKGSSDSAPSSESSATPKPSSSIAPSSGLSSANWTDSDGYQHYYVFHQNKKGDIIQSHYHSQNKTWKVRNVSASMESVGTPLSTILGTSISAIAWSDDKSEWNLRLYLLLTNNFLAELSALGPNDDSEWQREGTLKGQAGKGSNIAAWRPPDRNSSLIYLLMYQSPDQKITFKKRRENGWDDPFYSTPATKKSSLGVGSVDLTNEDLDGPQWRFYSDNSNTLQEGSFEDAYNGDWTPNWNTRDLGRLPHSINTNFAVVIFDLRKPLVVNIDGEDGLVARWYDDKTAEWSQPQAPELKDSPKGMSASSNFTAIAGNGDKRLYGLVDGAIHEWTFESKAPLTWNYVGEVNTTLSD